MESTLAPRAGWIDLIYHNRFNHFNNKTLGVTKELIKNWGTNSDAENFAKMKIWLKKVSEIYQIQFPILQIIDSAGDGYYSVLGNKIAVSRLSVVTLLHEFRHAMQFQNRTRVMRTMVQAEDDARAWSLSLYYKVAPKSFKRLVGQNKIMFVTAEDLLS